ncbi:hypothetical protein V5O48_017468, partial [Marasmius crinis-equi]
MDLPSILSNFHTVYKKVFPPFNSAYLWPSLTNKVTYLLDNTCHGNKEAYVALYLQYFILSNYKDHSFADQVAQLDPKQYVIYLGYSNPNNLINADWFSAHVQEYANVIAEIGILSVEVACLPGAPKHGVMQSLMLVKSSPLMRPELPTSLSIPLANLSPSSPFLLHKVVMKMTLR